VDIFWKNNMAEIYYIKLKSYYDVNRQWYHIYDKVGNAEVYVGSIAKSVLEESPIVADKPPNIIITKK
jgi:hypothetical protein